MTIEKICITRHRALVAFLIEQGIIDSNTRVIAHATKNDIVGKHVVGVLPLHLAVLAHRVTVVPLNLPSEARGRELSLEEVRGFADAPQTFAVMTAAAADRAEFLFQCT